MTILAAIVLVLVVVAFVILPLFRATADADGEVPQARNELWAREKAVAVLAITEADFDLATGKLSDADYHILRSDYEGRALQAMDEMEKLAPTAVESAVRFCAGCGASFSAPDAFCGSCGRRRFAA